MIHSKCKDKEAVFKARIQELETINSDNMHEQGIHSISALGELRKAQDAYNKIYKENQELKQRLITDKADLYIKIDRLNWIIERSGYGE